MSPLPRRSARALAATLLVAGVVAPTVPATAAPGDAYGPDGQPPAVTDRQDTPEDRYALTQGCYAITSLPGGGWVRADGDGWVADATEASSAEPFRFQATELGVYLLYTSDERFVANTQPAPLVPSTSVGTAAEPSAAAEWVVDAHTDGGFSIVSFDTDEAWVAADDDTIERGSLDEAGDTARFDFRVVDGCADYPEIPTNVTGDQHTGDHPLDEVLGYSEGHMHMMAWLFLNGAHCGQPWHRYGPAYALVDCDDHQANGFGALLETATADGNPVTHSPEGWPSFEYWPAPGSLTHENSYYRWTERAWRGGLRLYVNLYVENKALCDIYPTKRYYLVCDEMESVFAQAQAMRDLENYIDAQWGGPGEGWLRIVTDPFQARKVMNEGRLALVQGIEISELFNCPLEHSIPTCDRADVDAALDTVQELGVVQMEFTNKFDNSFAGVTGDSGETGLIVTVGNLYSANRFWDMETCDPDEHPEGSYDRTQARPHSEIPQQDAIFGAIIELVREQEPAGSVLPVYPEDPHCNRVGLLSLGEYLAEQMIERGMVIDPDHSSAKARLALMDIVEAADYSGVISSHTWASPYDYPRVQRAGGVITPYAGGSEGFVSKWRTHKTEHDDRYLFGLGYGADANGLGAQGRPRGVDGAGNPVELANPVTYPFEGLGGVTVHQQTSGTKTYDVNVHGVAHYGLYPDWIEDLRVLAGDEIVADMSRSAEAYLQMWERAIGVPEDGCRDDVTAATEQDLATLSEGDDVRTVLTTLGQPRSRDGGTYRFCIGEDGTTEATVTFDQDCIAVRIASESVEPIAPAPELPATGGGVAAVTFGLLLLLTTGRRHRRR